MEFIVPDLDIDKTSLRNLILLLIVSFAVCSLSARIFKSISVVTTPSREKVDDDLLGISVYDLAKKAYIPGNTTKVIRLVEKLNLNINKPLSMNGLTLFLCACISGERSLVLHLINEGADIHARSDHGDSALYLATHGVLTSPRPDLTLLDHLIYMGLDVDAQNDDGYTCLHRAVSQGRDDVIQRLLRHGASPNIATKSGIYPVDIAVKNGFEYLCLVA